MRISFSNDMSRIGALEGPLNRKCCEDRSRAQPTEHVMGRLWVFGIAIYVPCASALNDCLHRIRLALVPACKSRPHVTVVPAGPLVVDLETAHERLRALSERTEPFDIELGKVHSFPDGSAIYIDLASGSDKLSRLHDVLRTELGQPHEQFEYLAHVTIGQSHELRNQNISSSEKLGRNLWGGFTGSRRFRAEYVTLCQLGQLPVTSSELQCGMLRSWQLSKSRPGYVNCWIDVESYRLSGDPPATAS